MSFCLEEGRGAEAEGQEVVGAERRCVPGISQLPFSPIRNFLKILCKSHF